MILRDRRVVFRAVVCLVILALVVPCVSAVIAGTTVPKSADPDQKDQPKAIASQKMHIAYVGEDTDVSMRCTIKYIDTISNGTGTTALQQIRDDYLVIAASVPLMSTSAEIAKAREELRAQTKLFSDETKTQLVFFNGSRADMRASTQAYLNATRGIGEDNASVHWLANASARLTLFNRSSTERFRTLYTLEKQGVNTTHLQNISDQINAQHANLRGALANKSVESLKTTNTAIKDLTREFREHVAKSRTTLAIEMKRDAMMAMK